MRTYDTQYSITTVFINSCSNLSTIPHTHASQIRLYLHLLLGLLAISTKESKAPNQVSKVFLDTRIEKFTGVRIDMSEWSRTDILL